MVYTKWYREFYALYVPLLQLRDIIDIVFYFIFFTRIFHP